MSWVGIALLLTAIIVGVYLRERRRGQPPRRVVVKTVKGNRAAEQEISRMLALGYRLDGQSSRKVAYSLATGIFTRKQKHTLTFIRPEEPS